MIYGNRTSIMVGEFGKTMTVDDLHIIRHRVRRRFPGAGHSQNLHVRSWRMRVGWISWGYPNSWMVFVGKNRKITWMMTGGTPIFGNPPFVWYVFFGANVVFTMDSCGVVNMNRQNKRGSGLLGTFATDHKRPTWIASFNVWNRAMQQLEYCMILTCISLPM